MDKLNILVIGSGGREHALAWALRQSPNIQNLYIAPGNAGTEEFGENVPIGIDDIPALLDFVHDNDVHLTVVGPEAPLAAGIVDKFQAAGRRIFGPTQAAAQLEASKAFAKALMQQQSIPTAEYASFNSYDSARRYVGKIGHPVVVKADGLAAGKGVIMCGSSEDAQLAVKEMMLDSSFGTAGSTVVIEEWLTGREVSVLAFTDGKTVAMMPPARDYKRVFENDEGPNTGGMGAYAPVTDISQELLDQIRDRVLQPTIEAMAARGMPYVGVLYAGMMITETGPKTLEFNCRFGDPETQVILPLLDTDLLDILLACVEGRLGEIDIRWKEDTCATVVLASPGYPGMYTRGLPIKGLEDVDDENVTIFHAGTARGGDELVTGGGRVLAVSACGNTLDEALSHAYGAINLIQFDRMHYRKDIGR